MERVKTILKHENIKSCRSELRYYMTIEIGFSLITSRPLQALLFLSHIVSFTNPWYYVLTVCTNSGGIYL